jgi:hypothetical protein
MPNAPAPNRRFRFGMRTLFAALTIATVTSWLYWDGWGRYKLYQEQKQFESAVIALSGQSTTQVRATIPRTRRSFGFSLNGKEGYSSGYTVHEWTNAMYFFYFPAKDSPHWKRTQWQLFRVEPAPADYTAKTESGRATVESFEDSGEMTERLPRVAYWSDFHSMVRGDRSDPLGFTYTLIHASLPARR